MNAVVQRIAFRVGPRTVASVRRRLVRIALPLPEALSGRAPVLPSLPDEADGYSLLSVPLAAAPSLTRDGMIVAERQRYRRWYADLAVGRAAWFADLSGNLRSTLKRKSRKLAEASGGTLDVRRYRTPDELAAFHAIAVPLAERTYQARLLDMGLPASTGFVEEMLRLAAADRARGWLLYIDGEPAAYLYCPIHDGVVVYEFVGHDPRFDALSPGTVLMAEALGDLLDEGTHRYFDFTEGEGQHKRQFATGAVECCDLFLLRRTVFNRAAMWALGRFDRLVATVKRLQNGHAKPSLRT